MTRKIKVFDDFTPVYYWNKYSTKFFVVNQGGTNSSKTYSLIQVLIGKAIRGSDTKEPIVITVVAQTANALERGAISDFKKIIQSSDVLRDLMKNPESVRGPYYFKNGTKLEFVNLQGDEKARHGKRDYLFLNEANTIDYNAAKQLIKRTSKQVFFDYNPSARFWVHDEIIPSARCDFFISTYVNNRYCPDAVISELMDIKQAWIDSGDNELLEIYRRTKKKEDFIKWDKTTNYTKKNDWYVYGLGLTGVVEGAIYQDVTWIRFLPRDLRKRCFAIDFGFTNDPTTIIVAGLGSDNDIYAKELFYKTKTTTPMLIEKLIRLGVKRSDTIIADSSNQDAIQQIRDAGFKIIGAKKPAGSVKSGIQALLGMKINITVDSLNWKDEQQNYKYKKYKGAWLSEPAKGHDHLWDPLRYYYQFVFNVFDKKRGARHHKRKFSFSK